MISSQCILIRMNGMWQIPGDAGSPEIPGIPGLNFPHFPKYEIHAIASSILSKFTIFDPRRGLSDKGFERPLRAEPSQPRLLNPD